MMEKSKIEESLTLLESYYKKGILSEEEYAKERKEQLILLKNACSENAIDDLLDGISTLSIERNKTKNVNGTEAKTGKRGVREREIEALEEATRNMDVTEAKTLRDYQCNIIKEIMLLFQSKSDQTKSLLTKILLILPTGAGKTLLATAIIKAYFEKGFSILFLVNKTELVLQTDRAFRECHLEEQSFGFIKSGLKEHSDRPIQIASIQTLINRKMPKADLVFVDEAHRSLCPSYQKIFDFYSLIPVFIAPKDSTILGLTATPFRTKDTEKLSDIFQKFICGPSVGDLIEQGVLVSPIVYGNTKSVALHGKKESGVYEIEDKEARNLMETDYQVKLAVSKWRKLCSDRRTIAFCVNCSHAKRVAEEFKSKGIKAGYLDGSTKTKERQSLFMKLVTREIQVLTSVDVLSEGFDEPLVDGILLLRPTESKVLYIQQVGRGLRCAPKKKDCIVIDLAGNTWRHGCVTNPPQIENSKGNEPTSQNAMVLVRRCNCGILLHSQTTCCSQCNFVFQSSKKTNKKTRDVLSDIDLIEQTKSLTLKNSTKKPFWCSGKVDLQQAFRTRCKEHNLPVFSASWATSKKGYLFLKKMTNFMSNGQTLTSAEIEEIRHILSSSKNKKGSKSVSNKENCETSVNFVGSKEDTTTKKTSKSLVQ